MTLTRITHLPVPLSRRWLVFPGLPERGRKAETESIENGHHQAAQPFWLEGAKLQPIHIRAVVYVDHPGDRLWRLNPRHAEKLCDGLQVNLNGRH